MSSLLAVYIASQYLCSSGSTHRPWCVSDACPEECIAGYSSKEDRILSCYDRAADQFICVNPRYRSYETSQVQFWAELPEGLEEPRFWKSNQIKAEFGSLVDDYQKWNKKEDGGTLEAGKKYEKEDK